MFFVGTERNQRDRVLHFVDGGVVFRSARAVDAAQYPDQRRRRLVFRDTGWKLAMPGRTGNRVLLRTGPRGALAGHLEHIGPRVEHWEQVVPAVRIGEAEDPR